MMMALPNGSDVAIIAKTATRIAAMNGVAILNTVFTKPFAGGFKKIDSRRAAVVIEASCSP